MLGNDLRCHIRWDMSRGVTYDATLVQLSNMSGHVLNFHICLDMC